MVKQQSPARIVEGRSVVSLSRERKLIRPISHLKDGGREEHQSRDYEGARRRVTGSVI